MLEPGAGADRGSVPTAQRPVPPSPPTPTENRLQFSADSRKSHGTRAGHSITMFLLYVDTKLKLLTKEHSPEHMIRWIRSTLHIMQLNMMIV